MPDGSNQMIITTTAASNTIDSTAVHPSYWNNTAATTFPRFDYAQITENFRKVGDALRGLGPTPLDEAGKLRRDIDNYIRKWVPK